MPLTFPTIPVTVRPLTTVQGRRLTEVYASHKPPGGKNCPICQDTKIVRWYAPYESRDPESVAEYHCDCGGMFMLGRRYLYSGIGEAWQKLAWEDYLSEDHTALAASLDYLENADSNIYRGWGLCFTGTRGTGKSMSAMLLAKSLVLEGYNVYASTFESMIDAFAEGWRSRADRRWFNERVRNAHILVIDDLGREYNKSAESMSANAFEAVMRHRVQRDLPTIMTTNETVDALRKGYGGATASLMVEKMDMVEVGGSDWRAEKRRRDVVEQSVGIVRRPVLM